MAKPQKINDKKEMTFKLKDEGNNSFYILSFSVESNSLLVDIGEDDTMPSIHYYQNFL